MSTVNVTLADSGSCRVFHPSSQTTLTTDRPIEYGGKGRSVSATDLVAAALGVCILTSLEAVAERSGLAPGEMTVQVEKTLSHNPRRIASLDVRIRCPQPMTPVMEKKLLRAAAMCPVKRSLSPDVAVTVAFGARSGDPGPP